MRESRLFKLVYYLLDKGHASAPELAERFEVSVRTIYRDVEALSQAGIPVYTEAGRNGGIYLLGDFVLDKVLLSGQERQDILSSLHGLASLGDTSRKDTLEKLSAIFHVESAGWMEVDFSRWGEQPQANQKFALLKTAILHKKCVKLCYAGSYQAASERIVEPLKLFYKSKDWYLKAYCRLREDFRLFKLTRILEIEVLAEEFIPTTFPEPKKNPHPTYNRVTLRFPPEMAYRVYDEFDACQITIEENGGFTVTAEMPEDPWLIGFLLSLGTQVEIIEPEHLKNMVADEAKKIYEKYNT